MVEEQKPIDSSLAEGPLIGSKNSQRYVVCSCIVLSVLEGQQDVAQSMWKSRHRYLESSVLYKAAQSYLDSALQPVPEELIKELQAAWGP
eukprot:1216057-Karenia_brevis.AAC.1